MKNVPALNRIFAISVALISVSFFIVGLAAAFLAAAGVPFFYGYILIELFSYQDSVIDIFVGTMRVMAGLIPVFAVMGLSNIIVSYLTKGGSSARRELARMVRGFAYQLRHPFSDPMTPIVPRESADDHELKKEMLEVDALIRDYKVFFDSVYTYMGSYPLWKVQQEFRQLILALEPNTDNPSYEYHFHNIDNYLTKIIAVMASLNQIRPVGDPFWDDMKELSSVKGDDLLDKIKNKHPVFKGNSGYISRANSTEAQGQINN